jgi:hypothetical protein
MSGALSAPATAKDAFHTVSRPEAVLPADDCARVFMGDIRD